MHPLPFAVYHPPVPPLPNTGDAVYHPPVPEPLYSGGAMYHPLVTGGAGSDNLQWWLSPGSLYNQVEAGKGGKLVERRL